MQLPTAKADTRFVDKRKERRQFLACLRTSNNNLKETSHDATGNFGRSEVSYLSGVHCIHAFLAA